MAPANVSVLRHLRRVLAPERSAALTDAQLLEQVLQHRDEAAFAALVRRPGGWVGYFALLLDGQTLTRTCPWRRSPPAPASSTRAGSAVTSRGSSASPPGSSRRPQESPNRPQVPPRN